MLQLICLLVLCSRYCLSLPKVPLATRHRGHAKDKNAFLPSPTPTTTTRITTTPQQTLPPTWFKPGATQRAKWLAVWLLTWDAIALTDALMFTFRPERNLKTYLVGEWGPHALAQTRMLANCQLALIACVALIAWTGDEATVKNGFKIMILATLGAFRAVAAGVREGTIKAPWKTGYAAVMALPPLLLLSYFAFVF